MNFPKTVEVELQYTYLEDPIIYEFPRLRKLDAEIDEREKLLGFGKKISSAERLAAIVVNIVGFPGFVGRDPNESDSDWRMRVGSYFGNPEGEEFANDALVFRFSAVHPQPTFRGGQNNGATMSSSSKAANGSSVPLSNMHIAGKELGRELPQLRIDTDAIPAQQQDP